MDVAELVAYLGLAIDEEAWNRGQELIEKARHGVEGLSEASKKHHKEADEEKSKFGELNEVLEKGLETLIGYEGVKSFGELLEHTSRMVFEAGKMAQRIGMSVESLQALQYAASQSDVAVDSLQYGLQRLAFNLSLTGERGKFADEALRKIGMTQAGVQAQLKSGHGLDDVLGEMADKFKSMPDGAEKAAIAMQLFGRTAGPEMIPLLDKGREGLAQLKEEAEDLGATMGEEDVEQVNELEKAQKRLHARWEGLKFQLITAVIPAIHALVDAFAFASKVISHNTPVMIGILAALSAAMLATAASAAMAWYAIVAPFLAVIAPIAVAVAVIATAVTYLVEAVEGKLTKFGQVLVAVGLLIMYVFAPWMAVVTAIVALGTLLYRHWDEVADKFSEIWNKLTGGMEGVRDLFDEYGPEIAAALTIAFGPIGAAVAGIAWIITHWDQVKDAVGAFVGGIDGGAVGLMDRMQNPSRAGDANAIGKPADNGTNNNVEVHNNVTINTGASKDDVKQVVKEHFDNTMVHTMNAVKKGG
jgi:uncharacterized protein YjeT (DUF2065 family)